MNPKSYLIVFIFSLSICSCHTNVEQKFESGTWDFDFCMDLQNAVLYKKYLIITERDKHEAKFIVINYDKNEIDLTFQNKLADNGISNLWLENDTLRGYSDIKNTHFYWNNRKWVMTKKPFRNPHFEKFSATELNKNCYCIYEDKKYYIFQYSYGEFGSGIIFLNKENGILTGYPMLGISSIYSDTSGYIIAGNHRIEDSKRAMIIKIENPDLLAAIPDSITSKEKDWYGHDQYLHRQFALTFSDHRIRDELQETYHELDQFWENIKLISAKEVFMDDVMGEHYDVDEMVGMPDYDILFDIENRIDSLVQLDENLQYFLGRKNWYLDNNNLLCISSFIRNRQLLHVVEKDGCLLVVQLDKNGIKSVQDTLMCRLGLNILSFDQQFSEKRLLQIIHDRYRSGNCERYTMIIIYNGHLKRYNFGF